jgi:hypothetical protein
LKIKFLRRVGDYHIQAWTRSIRNDPQHWEKVSTTVCFEKSQCTVCKKLAYSKHGNTLPYANRVFDEKINQPKQTMALEKIQVYVKIYAQ